MIEQINTRLGKATDKDVRYVQHQQMGENFLILSKAGLPLGKVEARVEQFPDWRIPEAPPAFQHHTWIVVLSAWAYTSYGERFLSSYFQSPYDATAAILMEIEMDPYRAGELS